MNDYERALALRDETVAHRRWMHTHAEVGLEMPKAQAYVIEQLKRAGLEPRPCGHGVAAELGKKGGRTLLLRADMDALPMKEESGEPFACPTGTEAHACGHDFHTAMLLSAAKLLKESEEKLAGRVRFMFQPLALVELEADFRPNATIYKVKEAKSLYPFATLPYDPYKSAIALFLSEFLYRAVREEAENRPLFAYLYHSVIWLDECREGFANFHLVFLMRLSRFLGLYPNLEDYHAGDYFDLQNACFTPLRPQLHSNYIAPEEAARLTQLMRMNYETMHLFTMNRLERTRCLNIMNEYYRLHLPDFPVLKSLEVLKELFD